MTYMVPYHANEEVDPNASGYTLMDYTLANALNVSVNYDAEELVEGYLEDADPDFLENITFDSEAGCFFAYVKSEEDAEKLQTYISKLVFDRGVDGASVGTMADSPAYLSV